MRFDVDNDGEVTVKDFEAVAEKLIASRHLDEKRGTELKAKIIQVQCISLDANCRIYCMR